MSETFEIHMVDKEAADPHSYLISVTRPEHNFNSPTKRSFLNECIREIYLVNDRSMPTIPNNAAYNHFHIWNVLNELMVPEEISYFQEKVDKVKRRLFQKTKLRPRKINYVFRNNVTKTECLYYKHQRLELGTRKIPRNYLDDARREIYAEMRQKLKRKYVEDDDDDDDDGSDYSHSFPVTTEEGGFQVPRQIHTKIKHYHSNYASSYSEHEEISMEERIKLNCIVQACRINNRAKELEEFLQQKKYQEHMGGNKDISESAIRSMLYLMALRGMKMSGDAQGQ